MTPEQTNLLSKIVLQNATADDFLAVSEYYNGLYNFFNLDEVSRSVLFSFGISIFTGSTEIALDSREKNKYILYVINRPPPGKPIRSITHYDKYLLGGPTDL